MALITKIEARNVATSFTKISKYYLDEQVKKFDSSRYYDIFLSHSYNDAELVFGIKKIIEDAGFSVYIDWIEDAGLDRTRVTKRTATIIKQRMKQCRSLFFATTPTAGQSVWMPWELGFMDGYKSKVAIMPVVESFQTTFNGQEYLSLYPYIEKEGPSLFVCSSENPRTLVKQWLESR